MLEIEDMPTAVTPEEIRLVEVPSVLCSGATSHDELVKPCAMHMVRRVPTARLLGRARRGVHLVDVEFVASHVSAFRRVVQNK